MEEHKDGVADCMERGEDYRIGMTTGQVQFRTVPTAYCRPKVGMNL